MEPDRQLHVAWGDGNEDIHPHAQAFSVEEGVLLVFDDRAMKTCRHAYAPGTWGWAGWERR